MNLKILDYASDEYYINEVSLDDIIRVVVEVLTGDELLTVYLKSGDIKHFDVAEINHDRRLEDFYDGTYVVSSEDLVKWNSRHTSYDWVLEG